MYTLPDIFLGQDVLFGNDTIVDTYRHSLYLYYCYVTAQAASESYKCDASGAEAFKHFNSTFHGVLNIHYKGNQVSQRDALIQIQFLCQCYEKKSDGKQQNQNRNVLSFSK